MIFCRRYPLSLSSSSSEEWDSSAEYHSDAEVRDKGATSGRHLGIPPFQEGCVYISRIHNMPPFQEDKTYIYNLKIYTYS